MKAAPRSVGKAARLASRQRRVNGSVRGCDRPSPREERVRIDGSVGFNHNKDHHTNVRRGHDRSDARQSSQFLRGPPEFP